MPNPLRKSRNLIALTSSISLCIFYLAQVSTSWIGLDLSNLRGKPDYMDQELVLKWAACFKNIGYDVYSVDADPMICGGFQYSIELLRLLNITKLSSLGSFTLGTALMWVTILVLSGTFFLIKNQPRHDYYVAFTALASPGIWLLLERGNYDELVLILVMVGALLLGTKFQEFGVLLFLISALIKFYTLPLFIFSIFLLRRKISKVGFSVAAVPLTLYVLYLIKLVTTFPSTWHISFGIKSIGLYIKLFVQEKITTNFQVIEILVVLVGLLLLGLILAYLSKLEIFPTITHPATSMANYARLIYLAFLVVFLSCYFAGMNYDYRLVYLAVLVTISPLLFVKNRYRSIMVLSGLGSLWLSTFSFGLDGIADLLLQFSGDVCLLIFVATQLIYLFTTLKPAVLTRMLRISKRVSRQL